LTQVGDPLAHRQKGVLDCISCDRDTTGAFPSVAEAEDKEVGELVLGAKDVGEVRTDAKGFTEGGPEAEGGVSGFVGLGDVGGPCDVESSAEVNSEFVSGGS